MRTLRHLTCLLLAIGAAAPVFAATTADENNKTLVGVGSQVQGTGTSQTTMAYFYVAETWTLPCSNNVMYIDLSNSAGKAMYATILEAKATGTQIYRVYYGISGTTCTATLIEVR